MQIAVPALRAGAHCHTACFAACHLESTLSDSYILYSGAYPLALLCTVEFVVALRFMPIRFWPVIHHPFIVYLSYIDSLINLPRSRTPPPPPPHASI
jgi:hypothetical protein